TVARAAVLLTSVAFAAACTVGPNFSRPATPRVERYDASDASGIASEGKQPILSPAIQLRDDWWTSFGCHAIDMAVDQALTGNVTLEHGEATLRRSEHLLRAGAGVFFPQVDAQGDATRQRFLPLRTGVDAPASIFNLFTLSATVSYTLDIWGGE